MVIQAGKEIAAPFRVSTAVNVSPAVAGASVFHDFVVAAWLRVQTTFWNVFLKLY